uniref:Uncharacterized protein n=1 Tax=viral metagenome TaxID=1070528 RepID=A0A6M3IN92_9ZZZZ
MPLSLEELEQKYSGDKSSPGGVVTLDSLEQKYSTSQSVIPESQLIDPGLDEQKIQDVFNILRDPNEGREAFKNAGYFSRKLDMNIRTAYDLRQAIGSQLTGKTEVNDADISRAIKQIELEEWRPPSMEQAPELGFWGRLVTIMKDNLNKRNIEGDISRDPFTKFLLDKAPVETAFSNESRKDLTTGLEHGFRETGRRETGNVIGRAKMIGDAIGNEKLQAWSDIMSSALDQEYADTPEESIQLIPGTGPLGTIIQAIRRPEIIVQSAVEMIPMVATAVIGGMIFKAVGMSLKLGQIVGISEWLMGENYRNARKQGTEPGKAFAQSVLQSYGEGVLEEWSFSAKVNLFKKGFGQWTRNSIAKKSTDILLAGAKTFGRGFTEEASQDVNNRFWELIFTDEKKLGEAMVEAFGPGILESGAIGGVMESILGGASYTSGKALSAVMLVPRKAKVAKIDKFIERVQDNDSFTDPERQEILEVLVQKRAEVESGGEDTSSIVLDSKEEADALVEELSGQAMREGYNVEITQQGNKVTTKEILPSPDKVTIENGAVVPVETPQATPEAGEPVPDFDISEFETDQTQPSNVVIKPEKDVTNADRSVVRALRKDTAKQIIAEIEADPIFQVEKQAQAERESLVDTSKRIYFGPEFKGEVAAAIESNPILRTFITNDPTKGQKWDEWRSDLGDLSVTEVLEQLSQAVENRRKIGGIQKSILDAMVESGDPFTEIAATKHIMMTEGFSIQDINDRINDIAMDNEIVPDDYDLFLEQPVDAQGQIIPEFEKELVPLDKAPGMTKAEIKLLTRKAFGKFRGEQKLMNQQIRSKFVAKQLAGEAVGFKVGQKAGATEARAVAKAKALKAKAAAQARLAAEKAKAKAAKQKAKETFNSKLKEDRARARSILDKLKGVKKLSEANRRMARALVNSFIKEPEDLDIKARLLDKIASVGDFTDLQADKFEERVRNGIEKAERRALDKELKALFKSIKPKDMFPVFGKQVQKLFDMFAVTKLKDETRDIKEELLEFAEAALVEAERLNKDSVTVIEAKSLINTLKTQLGKIPLSDIPVTELQELIDILTSLDAMNKQEDSIISERRAEKIGDRIKRVLDGIRPNKVIKDPKTKAEKTKATLLKGARWNANAHGNLESISDNLAGGRSGLYQKWSNTKHAITEYIYDVIDFGVDAQYRHSEKVKNLTRELIKQFGVDPVALANETHTVDMEDGQGNEVKTEFSQAELMSIYMHTRNPHNLAVLTMQGMDRLGEKDQTEKIRGFTREKLDILNDLLAQEQKAMARAFGSLLMDGLNRKAINTTSLKMEGREIADVENYWPAQRRILRDMLGAKPKGIQSLLEGMGFLKERTGKGNPLRLKGFFKTIYETNKNVSAYVGLAPAMRDVKAVWNAQVQDAYDEAGWKQEAQNITDFIERIEAGSQEMSQIERATLGALARIRGQFAKSIFSLNVKLWARQQVSALLISAYVENKYMKAMKGVSDADTIARIRDLSPQTAQRFDSHRYDRDIGDAVLDHEFLDYLVGDGTMDAFKKNVQRKDIKGAIGNAQVAFLSGMKYFDTNAICDLFRTIEAELQDKRPDLEVNSKEYNKQLKDRFEWVARHTQPMWHAKDRSHLGGTQNEYIKTFTMFFSQREQINRMVTNAVIEYANGVKETADKMELAKVLGTVATNIAIFTAYNLAWASVIGGDEKKVADAITEMIKNTFGNIFFVGTAFTEVVRKVEGLSRGKYVQIDIDSGPISMIEPGLEGIAYLVSPLFGAVDDVEGLKKNIGRGTELAFETLIKINGLPYTGPENITKRLRKDDKKSTTKVKNLGF